MVADGNVEGKLSENKMGGEENLRTVECLRGRLLAERANSRVAKQDADKLGSKLIELENQLKTEMKSRNKAEKRLKSVMKKLQSLNIFYVSDESETSGFMEKSEISSISSTASSFMKQEEEDKELHTKITNSTNCEIKEPLKKKIESPIVSDNMKQIVPHTIYSDQSHKCDSNEEDLGTSIYENSTECDSNEEDLIKVSQNCHDSKTDDHSTNSPAEINGENDQDWEDSVDNSLALVLVDTPPTTKPTIDPPMASGSVKEVLDNLRYIREKIQSTVERRRMIRVGSR